MREIRQMFLHVANQQYPWSVVRHLSPSIGVDKRKSNGLYSRVLVGWYAVPYSFCFIKQFITAIIVNVVSLVCIIPELLIYFCYYIIILLINYCNNLISFFYWSYCSGLLCFLLLVLTSLLCLMLSLCVFLNIRLCFIISFILLFFLFHTVLNISDKVTILFY